MPGPRKAAPRGLHEPLPGGLGIMALPHIHVAMTAGDDAVDGAAHGSLTGDIKRYRRRVEPFRHEFDAVLLPSGRLSSE